MQNKLNLTISAVNVNSLNVSTLDSSNSKTLLKIEGVTSKRTDVILLSDVRAKNKGDEIQKLFNITLGGSYKIYLNSTRESRGVGIAIKWNIAHEIKNMIMGRVDENYLILDVIIKGRRMNIGVVYGPNGNNPGFFRDIRRVLSQNNYDFIIGGDFNTILSNEAGTENLDRIGEGRVPNVQNSRIINEWLTEGFAIDPFRALYLLQQEVSHIPFRSARHLDGSVKYVFNRLDFFLISPELLENVNKVRYEDRLGADFDHKEVILLLG
jgi:exonuclease III